MKESQSSAHRELASQPEWARLRESHRRAAYVFQSRFLEAPKVEMDEIRLKSG